MKHDSHSDWQHLLFYVGLALLTCHELDAVAHHEWRLLPVLSSFEDTTGLVVFVLLHIPIFTFLFWGTGHRSETIRNRTQISTDIFLIAHGVVHFALSGHSLYEFEAPVETITVYGGAGVGLTHLALKLRDTRNPS